MDEPLNLFGQQPGIAENIIDDKPSGVGRFRLVNGRPILEKGNAQLARGGADFYAAHFSLERTLEVLLGRTPARRAEP